MHNRSFIYAVCGADEYIDTLNFSLKKLKQFTQSEILVITDQKRNRKKIQHENILQVDTPEELNNHQASIYLKTSLHRYIQPNKNYCYLDSDVVAINDQVDSIFNYYKPPVTFCSDHTRIHRFSPYAINCDCLNTQQTWMNKLKAEYKSIQPEYDPEEIFHSENGRELYRELYEIRHNPIKNSGRILKFLFRKMITGKFYTLNDRFKLDLHEGKWIDAKSNIISYDPKITGNKFIKRNSEFRFHPIGRFWKRPDGLSVHHCECDHLTEAIKNKFNIQITDPKWQHWNGGVFLFSERSEEFMEHWHTATMEIFHDEYWKTRDQGTLAATAWKFNLENHRMIPVEFNFLADFYKPEVRFIPEKGFTRNNYKTTFHPVLIHFYQNFGNDNWDVWRITEI